MDFLIGLGVVVVIVVIVLVLITRYQLGKARDFEERRVAREEAQEREKVEKDRLLAPKRLAFAPIRAEIKAQEAILAANLDYHYEHHSRLVSKDKARLILYQQWLDDEDYKAGKLTDKSEKRSIDEIVQHLKVLVGAAENLSEADREAYKSKQQALFVTAQKFGRTITEHKHIEIAEERSREKMHLRFQEVLFESLNPSGEKTAQELGYSGLKEMTEKLDLKRQGLEPPPGASGIAAAKVGMVLFALANQIAVSDVMGKTIPTTGRLDAQASKYFREKRKAYAPRENDRERDLVVEEV